MSLLEAKKILERKKINIEIEKLKAQENKIQKLQNKISLFIPEPGNYGSNAIKTYIESKIKSDLNLVVVIADVCTTHELPKLTFYTGITKDLTQKGLKAKDLVNKIAEITGGRGGGRDDYAQAGGKDITKVEEALNLGRKLLAEFKLNHP